MTLANAVFFSLPGVFRACPTLANTVFSTLPGVRNENRPSIRFFRLTRSCSHCYKHFRAATSFPAALHFPPRRQRHFQRHSLFTAPPTSFPAVLRFLPRRQRHFQRRSALHRTTTILHNSAPPKKATGKPVAILNNEHAQNCYFFRISIAFGVREF